MMQDLYTKQDRGFNTSSKSPDQQQLKEIVTQNISLLFLQLTRGCGKPICTNQYCCNNSSKLVL
jgi:hypothetical protein